MATYKVSLHVGTTVMPGTGYQRRSVEWQSGFVNADSSDQALQKAKEYYYEQNTETCVITILAGVVSPATKASVGFFVNFFLPKEDE